MFGPEPVFLIVMTCVVVCLAVLVAGVVQHAVRDIARFRFRFRLRTLLVLFAVIQVFVGLVMSASQRDPRTLRIAAFTGGLAFVAWAIWSCFDDGFRRTASRRWKRIVRPERIDEPFSQTGKRKP